MDLVIQSMKNVWRMFLRKFYDITLPGMFYNIPRNIWRHSPDCLGRLPVMFSDIPRNFFFSITIQSYNINNYTFIIIQQLYYKYLQDLQRLHAKYAQLAKTTKLNLRNTARNTMDKNAIRALSPKPNTLVCWLGNDNNKESIRR